jgi:hypothetical protein
MIVGPDLSNSSFSVRGRGLKDRAIGRKGPELKNRGIFYGGRDSETRTEIEHIVVLTCGIRMKAKMEYMFFAVNKRR